MVQRIVVYRVNSGWRRFYATIKIATVTERTERNDGQYDPYGGAPKRLRGENHAVTRSLFTELLQIKGVSDVTISEKEVQVGKDPAYSWSEVVPGVIEAIRTAAGVPNLVVVDSSDLE